MVILLRINIFDVYILRRGTAIYLFSILEMRAFIYKLLVFFIIFFIFDKVFIVVREITPQFESDKRLERIITGNINKKILVFGSSRGARNVLVSDIENELNMESYNLSYLGSDIEFHLFLFKKLLKYNQKPEIVILVVDEIEELVDDKYIRFRLDRLYPLIKYKDVREELIARNEKNRLLSNLFILHQLNKVNFNFKKRSFSSLDSIQNCGSMPISSQKENIKWEYNSDKKNYSKIKEIPHKVKSFKEFRNLCIENDIKFIIAFAPNFRDQCVSFVRRIKELGGNETYYMNYDTSDIRYYNSEYFYDNTHLNKIGAVMYTSELINYLKDITED